LAQQVNFQELSVQAYYTSMTFLGWKRSKCIRNSAVSCNLKGKHHYIHFAPLLYIWFSTVTKYRT